MKDIFITSTFRNAWNKLFNLRLARALEREGFTIHLPQRDSEQKGNKKKTFEHDVRGIDNSRMVLAVAVKTQTANWGFEIGYAHKSKKPILIITDTKNPVEMMCEMAAAPVIVFDDIGTTDRYITDLVEKIRDILDLHPNRFT